MGSTSSKDRHQDSVDYGSLHPQGIYSGPQDWNPNVVTQFIVERKLAPFYTPLEDYSEEWDDDQILAARKLRTNASGSDGEPANIPPAPTPPRAHSHSSKSSRAGKEPQRLTEAYIYKSAIECPICFLYYPPNINLSRCCFQAICTECFVQVKRAEPTPTHLVSEPACCPYCVQENFGVTYTPPPWRAGIGSEGAHLRPELVKTISSDGELSRGRRKSFGHNSSEVVTVDQIRPDWEAKLAAVKAAVTRRANRRIIMRQVGDRLIPVGVTSGRVHTIQSDSNGTMAIAGQDLEELMMMEAMRLSLLEHEEQQRRAATAGGSANSATAIRGALPQAITSAVSASVPNPSTIEMASGSSNPRRRSHTPVVPSALGNASNVIAIAIGLPSDLAVSPNSDDATANNGQARRSESQPPPSTSSAAALSASGTATAFLRPSSPTGDAADPHVPAVASDEPNPPVVDTPDEAPHPSLTPDAATSITTATESENATPSHPSS